MPETGTVPCGACTACRKIEAGVHPDVLRVKPAGTFIRIDSIRSLQHSLSMRPYEADVRVVIVTGAQHMTPSAANAFLKMLEEPPAGTVLILIAERVSEMMPTVVSRCRRIHFNPIPCRKLADLLSAEAGIQPEPAHTAAAFSGGSLTRSRKLIEEGWFHLRDWVVDEFQQLPQMPIGRLLALADKLAADTQLLAGALDVLISWLRDLLIVRFFPAGVIHRDRRDSLGHQAAHIPVAGVMAHIRAVRRAQMDLRSNVGARLIAETLLLQLASRGTG